MAILVLICATVVAEGFFFGGGRGKFLPTIFFFGNKVQSWNVSPPHFGVC